MTPKQFEKFLKRDQYCLHCGATDETLVPQHRQNRQMGGSKARDTDPKNVIVFCSDANGRAESDASFARLCREMNWKLDSWLSTELPVYDAYRGCWWLLRNDFTRVEIDIDDWHG